MIVYKSPEEIERLRRAGRITADAIRAVSELVRPGVSTWDLDVAAERFIRRAGATPSFKGYRGFPASICTSVNQEVVHGIPSKRRVLRDGDLLSLDVGAIWEGYHGDSAVTVFVGAPPSDVAEKLVRVTAESLEAGIRAVRPGGHLSDVGHAVQQVIEGAGFGVIREYVGHGVGRALHEDPQVPNYGQPGRGPVVKAGLVIAIEPMVTVGDWHTRVLADRWTVVTSDGTLSAHFEHTLAVTGGGVEILTA